MNRVKKTDNVDDDNDDDDDDDVHDALNDENNNFEIQKIGFDSIADADADADAGVKAAVFDAADANLSSRQMKGERKVIENQRSGRGRYIAPPRSSPSSPSSFSSSSSSPYKLVPPRSPNEYECERNEKVELVKDGKTKNGGGGGGRGGGGGEKREGEVKRQELEENLEEDLRKMGFLDYVQGL